MVDLLPLITETPQKRSSHATSNMDRFSAMEAKGTQR
jgi:hypothetical protein